MKVQLIDYTGKGSSDPARTAAELLVFTKQTRLEMSADQMDKVKSMSTIELNKELEYMAGTIPSSWEFVHYTFLINDVTRAFTHQFVRTRTGSYAQQTMRVLDKKGWTYGTGPSLSDFSKEIYGQTMQSIDDAYRDMIDDGTKIEDARGVLPTNIHTNIVASFNLRTVAEMAHKRRSIRTQGEYRNVLDAMLGAVQNVHPWTTMFFDADGPAALTELERQIVKLAEDDLIKDERKIELIKLIDQARQR